MDVLSKYPINFKAIKEQEQRDYYQDNHVECFFNGFDITYYIYNKYNALIGFGYSSNSGKLLQRTDAAIIKININTLMEKEIEREQRFHEYINEIEIRQDGSFEIDDNYSGKMVCIWKKIGFLRDVKDLEAEKQIAYNMTMIAIYAFRCKPKEYVFEFNIFNILIASVRRIGAIGKIENLSKLWNYFIGWMKEHIDYFDKMQTYLDIDKDTDIISLFSEDLKKIILKME